MHLFALYFVVDDDDDYEMVEQPPVNAADLNLSNLPHADKEKGIAMGDMAPSERPAPTSFIASALRTYMDRVRCFEGPLFKVSSSFDGLDPCFMLKAREDIFV